MKVLMLSQDEKIFEADSAVARRIASYGTVLTSLTVVVFGAGVEKERVLATNVRAVFPGGKNKIDSFFRSSSALSALIKKESIDIVSSQDPFFLGIAGLRASRKGRVRFQAQLHTDCFSLAYALENPRNLLNTVLAFFVMLSADSVRVVSERIKRSVTQFVSVPVTVLPIRVPALGTTDLPKPSEFKGNFTVLSVARMTCEKQLHLIINAVALIPNVNLILVGDGPRKSALEQHAKKLGISDRVFFPGWRDPEAYYAHADAYVCASRYEGYGMSLVEAALHGLPIVTTDVGIVGEVLRDTKEAYVVRADSYHIAASLKKLMENTDEKRSMGENARKSVEARTVIESVYLKRYADVLSANISKTAS